MKFDPCWLDSVDVNAIPVEVIGSRHEGVWNFPNLSAAQKVFPELDPYEAQAGSLLPCAANWKMRQHCALKLGQLTRSIPPIAAGGFEPPTFGL